jgi:hypothetical protein
MHAYQSDTLARAIIHAVLAVNCCLILVHIFVALIAYFDFYSDQFFHSDLLITAEGGYPEMFNYLQLAVLGWLMFHVFIRTRQAIYAALGIIFLFALGDDALQLHERVGGYAADIDLPGPSFLGPQHFGELLQWLIKGALSIAALIYGLLASSAEDRKVGAIFIILVLMLGFFAVFVDAVHAVLLGKFLGANFVLGIAEDGGEMLTVALALSTALLLFRHLDDLRRPSRQGVGTQELSSFQSRV